MNISTRKQVFPDNGGLRLQLDVTYRIADDEDPKSFTSISKVSHQSELDREFIRMELDTLHAVSLEVCKLGIRLRLDQKSFDTVSIRKHSNGIVETYREDDRGQGDDVLTSSRAIKINEAAIKRIASYSN